jgi:hypothetical protein
VLMGYREGSTRSCAAADRRGTLGANGQPACAREPSTLARVGAGLARAGGVRGSAWRRAALMVGARRRPAVQSTPP